MRRGRRWLLAATLPWALPLWVLAGCAPAPPWPEAPALALDLRAALSASTVPLFAPFELQLDLFARTGIDAAFEPKVPDGCQGTVTAEPPRALGDGQWRRYRLLLRAVRGPGELEIAPFAVQAVAGGAAASTPALQLQVTSLLAGAQPDLEAPAPPFPPRSRWWPWLLAGAAALLAIAALLRWRRRRAPGPVAPSLLLPPHIKALRELARLRQQPRRTPAEIDAFYVAVSQVLRAYLEQRFGLHAPERTTEEFLQEVEAGGPLSAAQCLELRRFLQQCDLVKFAALVPAEAAHVETLAAAEALVEQTRPDRQPVEVSA